MKFNLEMYAPLAQQVERMAVNHGVAGSSPAWGVFLSH